jgi:hypothetical protein
MSDIRQRLRQFVRKSSDQDTSSFDDTTPLFSGGLLKSIQIMDLILLIEELGEREVDVEGLAPGSFRDIDTIMAGFFPESA